VSALRRVALLQYDWPLQSQTVNLARTLAHAGVAVDLYLRDCAPTLIDAEALASTPGIAVHDVSARGRLARLLERFERRFGGLAARAAAAAPGASAHDLYIGIEKRGLVWAGTVSERTGVPFVYYSLELYDLEHAEFRRVPGARRLRALEKRHHPRASATIVQDEARGAWLFRSNGLAAGPQIILPVSVDGPAVTATRRCLRERFNLPPERPILLYLGRFDEARGCLRLAELARGAAGERFAFVFHGYPGPTSAERLREASGGRAFVSTDLVPPERLPELVSSADIGLAFYRTDSANDELTAFSSEKVALYCQAGLPFIARDNASYRALVSEFGCARLVSGPEDVPRAAEAILGDRDALRRNAWRAFEARFRHGAHTAALLEGLAAAAGRRPAS